MKVLLCDRKRRTIHAVPVRDVSCQGGGGAPLFCFMHSGGEGVPLSWSCLGGGGLVPLSWSCRGEGVVTLLRSCLGGGGRDVPLSCDLTGVPSPWERTWDRGQGLLSQKVPGTTDQGVDPWNHRPGCRPLGPETRGYPLPIQERTSDLSAGVITDYTLESETAFFADDGRVADFGREAEVGLRGT